MIIKSIQEFNPKFEKSKILKAPKAGKTLLRDRTFNYNIIKYDQKYFGNVMGTTKNGYFAI